MGEQFYIDLQSQETIDRLREFGTPFLEQALRTLILRALNQGHFTNIMEAEVAVYRQLPESKWMDLNEFRDKGFLQEVNRLFFHPLGLALMVETDAATGEVLNIAGIQDCRNDIVAFGPGEVDIRKIESVEALRAKAEVTRRRKMGWVIQPWVFQPPEEASC